MNQYLSPETVSRLDRAELQAIAVTRGYDISDMAGTRKTRAEFLRLQDEDDKVERKSNSESKTSARKTPARKSTRKRR